METSLERLSKEQLITLLGDKERIIREKEEEATYLKALVEKFQRLAFAQKRERFEGNSNQIPLPFEASAENNRNRKWHLRKRKKPYEATERLLIRDESPCLIIYPWKKWSCILKETFRKWSASAKK